MADLEKLFSGVNIKICFCNKTLKLTIDTVVIMIAPSLIISIIQVTIIIRLTNIDEILNLKSNIVFLVVTF